MPDSGHDSSVKPAAETMSSQPSKTLSKDCSSPEAVQDPSSVANRPSCKESIFIPSDHNHILTRLAQQRANLEKQFAEKEKAREAQPFKFKWVPPKPAREKKVDPASGYSVKKRDGTFYQHIFPGLEPSKLAKVDSTPPSLSPPTKRVKLDSASVRLSPTKTVDIEAAPPSWSETGTVADADTPYFSAHLPTNTPKLVRLGRKRSPSCPARPYNAALQLSALEYVVVKAVGVRRAPSNFDRSQNTKTLNSGSISITDFIFVSEDTVRFPHEEWFAYKFFAGLQTCPSSPHLPLHIQESHILSQDHHQDSFRLDSSQDTTLHTSCRPHYNKFDIMSSFLYDISTGSDNTTNMSPTTTRIPINYRIPQQMTPIPFPARKLCQIRSQMMSIPAKRSRILNEQPPNRKEEGAASLIDMDILFLIEAMARLTMEEGAMETTAMDTSGPWEPATEFCFLEGAIEAAEETAKHAEEVTTEDDGFDYLFLDL